MGGVAIMLHAPSIPLAEGMVSPMPAPFLKYVDAVAQIPIGAAVRSPTYRAELTYIYFHTMLQLPVANRLKSLFKRNTVPKTSANNTRVAPPRIQPVNALVCKK